VTYISVIKRKKLKKKKKNRRPAGGPFPPFFWRPRAAAPRGMPECPMGQSAPATQTDCRTLSCFPQVIGDAEAGALMM